VVGKHLWVQIIDTVTGLTDTVCKVRGIALNYNASGLVNLKVIRDMNLWTGEPTTVTLHTVRKIKRKRKGGELLYLANPKISCIEFSSFRV